MFRSLFYALLIAAVAAAGVAVHVAVDGEGAAAELRIPDARGGVDGELAVLHAALDAIGELHQSGELEVDDG